MPEPMPNVANQYRGFTTAAITVSASTVSAKTAALVTGRPYQMVCTTSAFHFVCEPQATAAATTADHMVPSGVFQTVYVSQGSDNDTLAFVLDSGTATIFISPLVP